MWLEYSYFICLDHQGQVINFPFPVIPGIIYLVIPELLPGQYAIIEHMSACSELSTADMEISGACINPVEREDMHV